MSDLTFGDLLADILDRVGRIEQHLGITTTPSTDAAEAAGGADHE